MILNPRILGAWVKRGPCISYQFVFIWKMQFFWLWLRRKRAQQLRQMDPLVSAPVYPTFSSTRKRRRKRPRQKKQKNPLGSSSICNSLPYFSFQKRQEKENTETKKRHTRYQLSQLFAVICYETKIIENQFGGKEYRRIKNQQTDTKM